MPDQCVFACANGHVAAEDGEGDDTPTGCVFLHFAVQMWSNTFLTSRIHVLSKASPIV
ncbi:hypothetical protein ZHAS_00007207 [Anopheles sinensis]|uniref:Uncharacterized protein n=1 Tax=Anopheles sinensis TaxID=74873 RepID=A0A084VPE2_ANOSI|nr:hypothetical protein ZHAS_00007207 [Anopheles sinensis]